MSELLGSHVVRADMSESIHSSAIRRAHTLLVIAVLLTSSFPKRAFCCQTATTIAEIVSPVRSPPDKTDQLSDWHETEVPACDYWTCSGSRDTAWVLSNDEIGISVEWHRTIQEPFQYPPNAKTVRLPEAGYDLVYSSNEETVSVMTSTGRMDVPKSAFIYESDDGYFFRSTLYSCTPSLLYFYPNDGRTAYRIDETDIFKIVVVGGSLWGLAGSEYVGDGELFQIKKDKSGNWFAHQFDTLDGYPAATLALRDGTLLIATSRSIRQFDGTSIDTLIENLPMSNRHIGNMIENTATDTVYLSMPTGILQIYGIHNLFGPRLSLFVPNAEFAAKIPLSYCCKHVPGWFQQTIQPKLDMPWAKPTLIALLAAFTMLIVMGGRAWRRVTANSSRGRRKPP